MNALDSRCHASGAARRTVIQVLALLLAGCASTTGVSPLAVEQRWLEEWFRGTPVVITLHDRNTLVVDVPLANSFASGSSGVKPALAAVLDRVATSLLRQPALRVSITAPTDADGPAALAAGRTQQVRDQLIARGVAGTRTAALGAARAGTAVQLRLVAVAPLIVRLDDATLPPPPARGAKGAGPAAASSARR